MSSAELLTTPAMSLPPVTYKGQPVVTTEMLAQAYGCSAKSIRQNFNNNRERFVEGKHFYSLQNGELQSFRDCVENFDTVVPARTRNLTLWLERGAARHAKMLNTDRAWDVFEMLEETFFRVVNPSPVKTPALPESPITPDQQKTLQDIVKAKVDTLPEDQRHGGLYPQVWTRFKNHFRIPRYNELPQSRMSDAIAYLMQMELRKITPKELPDPMQAERRRIAEENIVQLRRVCNDFHFASDRLFNMFIDDDLIQSLNISANLSNHALLRRFEELAARK